MNGNLEISGVARRERKVDDVNESQESEIEGDKDFLTVEQLVDR